MGFDVSHVFLNKLTDMVQFLLPNYVQEGKNQLTSASAVQAANTVL